MEATYTGRKEIRRDGRDHFAEVRVRATPCPGPTEVALSDRVLATLREVFGEDFEHQRHCVWAAVAAQIGMANVAGDLPRVGVTCFRAEVTDVLVSGNAGREVSGFLLTVAGMDAIAAYLIAWESAQSVHDLGPRNRFRN